MESYYNYQLPSHIFIENRNTKSIFTSFIQYYIIVLNENNQSKLILNR